MIARAESRTQNLAAHGLREQEVVFYPFPFSSPRIVRNALCPDGSQRSAYCSEKGADTFFSIPASVRVRGTSVSGYVTRETLAGFASETPEDPALWKFHPYTYGRNAGLIGG